MTYNTALGIGHIHRHLRQPVENDETGRKQLYAKLNQRTTDSLKYVCVDVNCMPPQPITKGKLIKRMVEWVGLSCSLLS
jgi:hypothetical protein